MEACSNATAISRGDINGAFQMAERSIKVTKTLGNRIESTTLIERPTLNGSMDTVERNEQAIVSSGPKTMENVTIFRRDANGRMDEFARKTREAVAAGGQVTENTAEYESASTGQMKLMRQSTAKVDPTGTREVNIYLPNTEGKSRFHSNSSLRRRKHRQALPKPQSFDSRYPPIQASWDLPGKWRKAYVRGLADALLSRDRSTSAIRCRIAPR